MSNKIGVAMAGGNPREGRNADDYYPTPDECTIGLLIAESAYIEAHTGAAKTVWEPACGCGAMSSVLKTFGYDVVSSDLIDRGYPGARSGMDFLEGDPVPELMGKPIITNPPFNLAPKFIRRAMGAYEAPYLALLLKSTFWHAKTRLSLFEDHPPSVVYPMTWRPDFMKRGSPTMDCSWMVWDLNRTGTSYVPMRKPTT